MYSRKATTKDNALIRECEVCTEILPLRYNEFLPDVLSSIYFPVLFKFLTGENDEEIPVISELELNVSIILLLFVQRYRATR